MQKSYSYEQFFAMYTKAKILVKRLVPNTAASHNRILQFQRVLELEKLPSAPHTLTLYNAYWDHFLSIIKPFPHVIEFLSSMKEIATTCLVTNLTAHIQYRKIMKLGIDHLLDYVVTSEESGIEKPDPLIFKLALAKTQTTAHNSYMIGDSFTCDVEGAQQVGIKSLWYSKQEVTSKYSNVISFNSFSQASEIVCKTM